VFQYVLRGGVNIDGDSARGLHLVELSDEGDALALVAESDALLLFGHAAPIGEPVVAHGPFVMNTREQVAEAIAGYQAAASAPRCRKGRYARHA
jgi:quercetin 2,3-dioxygenase